MIKYTKLTYLTHDSPLKVPKSSKSLEIREKGKNKLPENNYQPMQIQLLRLWYLLAWDRLDYRPHEVLKLRFGAVWFTI